MPEERNDSKLGILLKSLLTKQHLSMRRLCSLTGIDTATISRICNGKQKAKPDHLQKIAFHLGVPLEQLFEAAGYLESKQPDELEPNLVNSFDAIAKSLESSYIFDEKLIVPLVEQELSKYEQYSQTEEGNRLIASTFQTKIEQVSGAGPFIDQLKKMFDEFNNQDATAAERKLLGSALLYFILSTDIIPDYTFPIGYLDDAMAVSIVRNRLSKLRYAQQIKSDE